MDTATLPPFKLYKSHPEFNVIGDRIRALDLPQGWRRSYSEKSIVLTNPNRSKVLKIDVSRTVYLDCVGKAGVKSHKYNCITVEKAWSQFLSILKDINEFEIQG